MRKGTRQPTITSRNSNLSLVLLLLDENHKVGNDFGTCFFSGIMVTFGGGLVLSAICREWFLG